MNYTPSEGGLATGLGSIYKKGNNLWLGWPGISVDVEKTRKKVISDLSKENMYPVFLSQDEIGNYYEGFSNGTIWPNFHYFNQHIVYKDEWWESYVDVNRKFCVEIEKVCEPDDYIWIHDYQLLLLPEMIREKIPEASIGFFQHIPFPSYENFRILPWRRELLNGMLGADLIGFHTYDDMRHFLSSANRLAGMGNSHGIIEVNNRKVMVDSFPMGIDYDKYALTASEPETLAREVRYRTSLGDQKIILSIDRLDYSKGIPQRLRAFERFLDTYPEFEAKVSLMMVVVPSRDKVGKYKELRQEVDLLVGRINGRFSRVNWNPIHYFYRSLPLPALSAFYRMAHIALVTPLRDGMNLVCKEFIASKLDKTGVLILSEMAGSSKELSDAILINPNDLNQIVDALHRALVMPVEEQKRHMEVMQESLKRYNIHHWVDLFTDGMNFIKEQQKSMATKKLDQKIINKIKANYSKSKERLIFLDYDGTLAPFHANPKDSAPDDELRELLTKLTGNKKNRVIIISGREKDTLHKWLGDLPLDFIAEHGVWLKEKKSEWQTISNLEDDWKSEIRSILEVYVDRTPGSFIEEKDYSLVWHYRKVETGLGELRTRELTSHMKYLTYDRNLHVMEGNMVVEIKSSEVNKGVAAKKWLDKYPASFIMAIGDDMTDEDTFKAMPEDAYTIKVHGLISQAKYTTNSHKNVRELLKELNSA